MRSPPTCPRRVLQIRFRAAAVLLVCGTLTAQTTLPLNVKLYDHNYGDFGGDFSAISVTTCNYNVYQAAPGMVTDSLYFDSVLMKKNLRQGPNLCGSANIGKWFDPNYARVYTCGNLFFNNVGTTAAPRWRFDDTVFHPMDSLSLQPTWDSGGVYLPHDFAFCMEINTGFVYQGGDSMWFKADDDLWAYLDNHLVADLGGVHYYQQATVKLDTLPFLRGRQGQNLDLDVYYCGRQPATTVFGMETNVKLTPLAVKDLQIVDTLGQPVIAKSIIVGKTRVCARPDFLVPGDASCGNYEMPAGLSFLDADWVLNGQTLSISGGQQCLDLDPSQFANNQKINITATAEDKTAGITLTLVRVAKPVAGWLHGNGRAETVQLNLDTAGGPAPNGLQTAFTFAGREHTLWAYPAGNSPDTLVLTGTLGTDPGPLGLTGFTPIPAATQQTIYSQVIAESCSLKDGVSPIATSARFDWDTSGSGFPAVLNLGLSEPLSTPANLLVNAVAVQGPDGSALNLSVAGCRGLYPDAAQIRLLLPELVAENLRPGDSLTLTAAAMDTAGNPAQPYFIAVDFPNDLSPQIGNVHFQNAFTIGAEVNPLDGDPVMVLVDASGNPLWDREPDSRLAAMRGPVLEISTQVPLSRIQLQFFDHLGNFINAWDQTLTAADWERVLRAGGSGDTEVYLMWVPVSSTGHRVGTGVYIVQGQVWSDYGSPVSGADGVLMKARATHINVNPIRFGYVRH